MPVYYNENDRAAAAWLRELIRDGQIPAGDVDERSIEDVRPDDLVGYRQCHFFAGIGGWPLALRWAGWPDESPVWTGSCPCQPFSAAGKGAGASDERHLWPAFFWLIGHCEPPVVFGEQVASKAGRLWLSGVRADLETLGYAVGAADLCAAGVGAPHIRQRGWWVARAAAKRPRETRPLQPGRETWPAERGGVRRLGHAGRLGTGRDGGAVPREKAPGEREGVEPRGVGYSAFDAGADCRLGDAIEPGLEGHPGHGDDRHKPGRNDAAAHGSVAETGGWSDFVWVPCADGKARRIEPGIEPLVDGLPRGVVPSRYQGMAVDANRSAEARVMRLSGYGNGIVPWLAAEFAAAAMEARPDLSVNA